MEKNKNIIKKTGKSFRLIDFHVFNKKGDLFSNEDSSSDESDGKVNWDENENFIIQMFGINEKGQTCCIYLNDYKPFFFIKVGANWSEDDVIDFKYHVIERVGKYFSKSILSFELVSKKKLYGFTGGKEEKFVKINFDNTTVMNKVRNLWYTYLSDEEKVKTGNYKKFKGFRYLECNLELYESSIPPLLRYFHINNISPSGWVFINTKLCTTPEIKTTTCKFEYVCKNTAIKPMPNKETIVPYKICSFDIEASSSHGDFPLPIKTYKRLAMNIVDVFQRISRSSQKIDKKSGNELLKRCILTSFNMDNFENIDLVYPKTKPSKEFLLSSIEILLNKPVIEMMQNKEAKGLDVETSFEIVKDTMATVSENVDDNHEQSNNEVENVKTWNKMKSKSILKKSDNKCKIIDILLHNEYDRESKIKILNILLQPDDNDDVPDGHCLRLFPNLEGDKVTFIGSTFLRYGEKEPYLNHCLVLGGCKDVEGAVIETTKTEQELLLKWKDLIQKEDPDVIIGYNIFGFDYEFMFRRAQENYCERQFLQLSRIKNDICAKEVKSKNNELAIENTKIVLATGEYDLRFYKTIGRLQVDMYTYFRRDFNLASYKLDDVAGQYISDSIKHFTNVNHEQHGEITELYSKNLSGLHVGDYIHIELSSFTSDYYKGGKKFQVIDIVEDKEYEGKEYNVIVIEGKHLHDTNCKSIKWGVAKDDVTPQDIFRLSNGDDSDRAIVAKYCIQDCNLVHHLMSKIDVLTGYVEMSSICSVPISFLVFRGQGIKLTSYVAKKCREKDTLMPDLEKSFGGEGYEGAIVLPPKCSMYMDNPVACVDYASLYPSSMISQNYSHDSKVWTKEYDLQGELVKETGEKDKRGNYIYDNLPDYEYIDIEFDTYRYTRKTPTSRAEKVICGKKTCRWAQLPEEQKSIMPAILEELLKARKDTRKKAKSESDPFMQNILDKRQLGYKVTANSLYGQCGAKTSTFYEQDVAASTTATGRMMITYARRMIEELYGNHMYETKDYGTVKCNAEYIYGDTDSVFFTFNLEDPVTNEKIRGKKALEITIEIAQVAANICTQFLKAPQCLEYEKTLMPFILLSKKRYVGMLYEEDANKGSLKYMGLSLKRRDSCDYLKDTYGNILNILMKNNNVQDAIQYLNESLENLINGTVSMDKLTITKALRSDYKNPMQIGHWVLAERIGKRDPGNRPKPGDRMKFVFIENKDKKALVGDKIETPEFILENNLQIDYNYYITNQLMKPLQQLFGLALENIWELQKKTGAIKSYKKEIIKLQQENEDMELFMKKKEKYCSNKIKILLFDKHLTKIEHKRSGMQPISNFFSKG